MPVISDALRALQSSIDTVVDEYAKKQLVHTKEYKQKSEEVFRKRADIIKKVDPKFWGSVFASHEDLAELLGPYDNDILLDLDDFFVSEDATSGNMKFVMTFKGANAYIEDKQLWKEYDADGKVIGKSGCKWKSGHNVQLASQTAGKNEMGKREREDGFPSFFTFFMEDRETEVEEDIAGFLKEMWDDPFETLLGGLGGDDDEEEDEEDDDDEDDE
eukprot:PhM_4_TR13777/c0_g1_i1/m.32764/K11290/SET, TAF1, I2PP2A; template-activating factor I